MELVELLERTNTRTGALQMIQITQERLKLAIDWILNSGIQHPSGYFSCWFDINKSEYPFIYGEMIGYGIETFLWLYHKEKHAVYLDRARSAADWLLDNMSYKGNDPNAKGAFVWKCFFPSFSVVPICYAFDTGMCLSGLTDLFRTTGEQKYLESAISAGRWLVDVMQNDDGSFKARYDHANQSFNDGKWSTNPGSYHAKLSIGLLKLYKITKDETLANSVTKLCDWVLSLQQSDGRFLNTKNSKDFYLHSHCYTIEGLFFAARKIDYISQKLDRSVLKGTRWLVESQKPNGGISRLYSSDSGFSSDENAETLAQTIRLCLFSISRGNKSQLEKLEKMISRLLNLQCTANEDKRAKGGFYYAVLENELIRHVNCCATLFSAQAMQMYLDWKLKRAIPRSYIDYLI